SELKEYAFEAADHLNKAQDLVTDPRERLRIAALNLSVARRAKDSSAYEPAKAYAEAGLALLPADAWRTHYDLVFDLRFQKGELEYRTARWEASLATLTEMLGKARTRVDRARVCALVMVLYRVKNELRNALDTGIRALTELGIHLDAAIAPEALRREIREAYA